MRARSGQPRTPRGQPRLVLALAIGAMATGVALLAYATDVLVRTELSTVDARFSVRGKQAPPSDIVLVNVDDVTFSDLALRWPFPRSVHAKLVARLRRAGAKAIVYDVQFTERTTPREDNALIAAVARAHNVVLSTTEVGQRGSTNVLGGDAVLRRIGARAAETNFVPDQDGAFRHVPYELDGLKSLAVATTEMLTGHAVPRSSYPGNSAWIDYAGPPGTIPAFSFSRVLRGAVPSRLLRGKVVVVGASAPSLQDVHATATTGSSVMSGPEIQANAIATLRRGIPLRDASSSVQILLIAMLGFVTPLASLRLQALRAFALALVVGALFAVCNQFAFQSGVVLSFVYPLTALALSAVGTLGMQYMLVAVERRRVRDTFARFVPENVVSEVLDRAGEGLRLGGREVEVTVLFSDLRGFTSFAESRNPAEVIEILNRYLSVMTDAIMDNGGTLVSYMGDGIMAVFGAPLEQPDHADRALATAREMTGERLVEFNAWLRGENLGEGFRMGVGLNTGMVMAGNVGSERRMEYTTIGDTTNTASRLEGMTKGTPYMVYIGDSTRAALQQSADDLVFVEELEVRGRAARIRVWGLAGEVAEPADSGAARASDAGAPASVE